MKENYEASKQSLGGTIVYKEKPKGVKLIREYVSAFKEEYRLQLLCGIALGVGNEYCGVNVFTLFSTDFF